MRQSFDLKFNLYFGFNTYILIYILDLIEKLFTIHTKSLIKGTTSCFQTGTPAFFCF